MLPRPIFFDSARYEQFVTEIQQVPHASGHTQTCTLTRKHSIHSVESSVKDQLGETADAYKYELIQLAKDSTRDNLPAEAAEMVIPLIDAVSDGDLSSQEVVAVLTNAAQIGVTGGCVLLTSPALAPVCAAAGGIVGKLLGGLLSGGTTQQSKKTPFIDIQLPLIRTEKAQVLKNLLNKVSDPHLRDECQKLVDSFYDESVIHAVNYGPSTWVANVGTKGYDDSNFWRSPYGGGFFSIFANYYQVMPWELGKETQPVDDKFVAFGDALNAGLGHKKPKTGADNLKACLGRDTQACAILESQFYAIGAEGTSNRKLWLDAVWAFLLSKGIQLKSSDRKTWFPPEVMANPEWVQLNMRMVIFPYIKAKFENFASAIIAADMAIRQKPILDALNKVTEQIFTRYSLQCTSQSCRDIVQTKANKLAKDLVVYASKGPSQEMMEAAISDAESELSSAAKIGSAVEVVEETKAKQEDSKKSNLGLWIFLGLSVAAVGVGYTYRDKLGFKK